MTARILLLSNIPPDTPDEELLALVRKYAPELQCIGLTRVEGDGTRPTALLSFKHLKEDSVKLPSLENLCERLEGMHWKGRMLSATTTLP
jgi:hypothetical protein